MTQPALRLRIHIRRLSALVLTATLLTACGAGGEATLEELVQHHSAFDGDRVTTRGTVQTVDEPRHYWLEDDNLNRVGLVPDEKVEDLVDEQVIVQGRFSYSPEEGRSIQVDEVTLDVER